MHCAGKVTPTVRPWSTMECSHPAEWTTNRSLLVASRAKAFPRILTNSGSTLPGAAHLDGDVIGCHQCITWKSGGALASPTCDQTPWPCPACMPFTTSIPVPTQPTIAMTNYIHASTVIKLSASSSASEIILRPSVVTHQQQHLRLVDNTSNPTNS